MERTLRGRAAIAGIGETTYYRHGESPDPEFKLAIEAVLTACADAGIDPREIDGFSSYSNDRSDAVAPGRRARLPRAALLEHAGAAAGAGRSGAVANGAAAIATGQAEYVVVFRGARPGPVRALRPGPGGDAVSGGSAHTLPYGLMSRRRCSP